MAAMLQEIQQYVQTATEGASSEDPFEVRQHQGLLCFRGSDGPFCPSRSRERYKHSNTGIMCLQGMSPEEINAYMEEHGAAHL